MGRRPERRRARRWNSRARWAHDDDVGRQPCCQVVVGLDDHGAQRAVGDHQHESVGRVSGIERYVGRATLECRQHGDQHVGAAPERDAHTVARSHTALGEHRCEVVHALPQLRVAVRHAVGAQCRRVGCACDLLGDEPVDGGIAVVVHRGRVDAVDHIGIGTTEDLQRRRRGLRRCDASRQQERDLVGNPIERLLIDQCDQLQTLPADPEAKLSLANRWRRSCRFGLEIDDDLGRRVGTRQRRVAADQVIEERPRRQCCLAAVADGGDDVGERGGGSEIDTDDGLAEDRRQRVDRRASSGVRDAEQHRAAVGLAPDPRCDRGEHTVVIRCRRDRSLGDRRLVDRPGQEVGSRRAGAEQLAPPVVLVTRQLGIQRAQSRDEVVGEHAQRIAR